MGCLQLWSSRQYDSQFKQRNAIKANVMPDFITESSPKKGTEEMKARETPSIDVVWTLHCDGASNTKGAGIGFMLVMPNKVAIEFSTQSGFSATNNEYDYEALINGLNTANSISL